MKNWQKLVISLLTVFMVAFFSSFLTAHSIDTWYDTINKPAFNPPDWIFGPVWTVLYIMIGVSLFLVWKTKSEEKTAVYWAFATQLTLNFLWSILFFGNHYIPGALIDIGLLWLAILANIILAWKISKPASLLLVPYWLWVSFAAFLNYSIWMLNK